MDPSVEHRTVGSAEILSASIRSIRFQNGKNVCADVTIVARKGECILVQAPTGWGKSVLFSLLSGWSEQLHGLQVDGVVQFNGEQYDLPADMCKYQDAAKAAVGCLFHRLGEENLGITVEEEIAQIKLRYYRYAKKLPICADRLLAELERLDPNTPMRSLAKGLRQILAVVDVIAAVSTCSMLVLDEPSSYLCDEMVMRLHELIHWALKHNPECAVLMSSHDRRLASDTYRQAIFGDAEPGTRHLKIDLVGLRSLLERSQRFAPIGVRVSGRPTAQKVPLPFRFDVEIGVGESCLVTGANGSGKSSLLNVIGGLYGIRGISRVWDRKRKRVPRRHLFRGHLGLVFQEPHEYEFRSTVGELLKTGSWLDSTHTAAWQQFLYSVLRAYEIPELQDPRTLSSGQLRVLWVVSQLGWCSTWLLDEVDAALDSNSVTLVRELLAIHVDLGGSIIVASHCRNAFPDIRLSRIRLEGGTSGA